MPASLMADMESSRLLQDSRLFDVALNMQTLFLANNENECLTNNFECDHRSKKSQNTTECVPVPSSEHVAEIVGRQGCKIKALRAKTNTYIKTPVRGEEPVFVVTGRKEDVNSAKREILSAAEHFSQIRAQRKNNLNGTLMPGPNSTIPGQTTIQVRVPYRVVGLVVGPKGATIKRIQQTTNTYIVTPSRDKDPVFEVSGLPENVESAKKEIEAHIAMRTGGAVEDGLDDYNSNPMDSYTNNLNAINSSSFLKSDLGSNFICQYPPPRDSNNILDIQVGDIFSNFTGRNLKNDVFNGLGFGSSFGWNDPDDGIGSSPPYEASGGTSSWPDVLGNNGLTDSGIFNSSPLSGNSPLSELSQSLPQRSNSLGSGLTDLYNGDHHAPARRILSEPVMPNGSDISVSVGDILSSLNIGSTLGMSSFAPLATSTAPASLATGFAVSKCTSSSSSSPIESLAPGGKKLKRDCMVCYESEVVAALVPCGHNLFCMECAQRIVGDNTRSCPICSQPSSQAIRIYN